MSNYVYNVFTGTLDNTGDNGGGGSGIAALLSNDGSPTIGSTPGVTGQSAGNSPVLSSRISSGNLVLEDRTWNTRYVVDPSSTPGVRGTYQTIGDALTQAAADGWSYVTTGICTIFVRRGAYTENVTIPSGLAVHIIGYTPSGPNTNFGDVVISGTITLSSGSYVVLENMAINASNGGADSVLVPAGVLGITMKNVALLGGTTSSIRYTGAGQASYLYDMLFASPLVIGATTVNCYNSSFQAAASISGGTLNLRQCDSFGVELSGSGNVNAINSRFFVGVTGTTSATPTFYNSSYLAANANSAFLGHTGNASFGNISVANGSDLYTSSVTPLFQGTSQGNVIKRTAVSSDYTVLFSDYYIGVTSTAAPRTITLPNPATISKDQSFTVKDESMGAASNNITVVPSSGLIDGAANKIINTNGGALTVISNGTNYFIF